MTSHAHNLRVCLFTLLDQCARGRSQGAGCRCSFRSCQLPSSTAPAALPQAAQRGPASPEAHQWRVLASCLLRESSEKQGSTVPSSSVPLGRRESRVFLMFEVVIVSFCEPFLHGLFPLHLVWGHPRLTVFEVTGNPRGTESALRGCCKCFPTFSAVAFCPVFCAMGKSLYLYGVKFISPFSYRLWILSHRPTFPTLANKKFTVWCHF